MVNSWTFSGGGLDPASYGGNFRPSNFVSDSGSTGTAALSISGLTSGGLGSSTLGSYGGLYTFFSTNVTLGLQVTGILAGIDEITLRLVAGGGSPALTYSQNSLTLNYNSNHPGLVASTLATVANIKVPSPIGEQDLTSYTWKWNNLSSLGVSEGFSLAWNTQGKQHAFFSDISVTQSIPEPTAFSCSAFCAVVWLISRRKKLAGRKQGS